MKKISIYVYVFILSMLSVSVFAGGDEVNCRNVDQTTTYYEYTGVASCWGIELATCSYDNICGYSNGQGIGTAPPQHYISQHISVFNSSSSHYTISELIGFSNQGLAITVACDVPLNMRTSHQTIEVCDYTPTANIVNYKAPYQITSNSHWFIEFSAVGSYDIDGDIVNYQWSGSPQTTKDNGRIAVYSTVNQPYGNFTRTVTVNDNDGYSDTKSLTLDLGSAPSSGGSTPPVVDTSTPDQLLYSTGPYGSYIEPGCVWVSAGSKERRFLCGPSPVASWTWTGSNMNSNCTITPYAGYRHTGGCPTAIKLEKIL
ncbi:hypothetical protein [Teredinibacter purpureus]|uniref:hypothetical protein n=1 Tax=Teredinibacter purpureus TaxID=2731756 RepID=UPI0005F7A93D|nr:hypothetical protein [Teredinibacter purpureus]